MSTARLPYPGSWWHAPAQPGPRLDPAQFVRVHHLHAVRIDRVRELVPQLHGEFLLRLGDGVELVSGRSDRATIRATFGLE